MIRLALKDLKLFLKDKRALLLSFALPIVLITLFAFAFGGVGSSVNDTKIPLLISDLDQTQASADAIKILDTLEGLSLKKMSLEKAQENVKKGNKGAVLVFQKGFSDSINKGKQLPLELQYDEAQEIQMGLLQQSLIPTVAMMPFSIGNPKDAMRNRFNLLAENSDPIIQQEIYTQSDNLFEVISNGVESNSSSKTSSTAFFGSDLKMTKLVSSQKDNSLGLIQAVAGTAVMMLLFSVVSIGMGLLDEKAAGTIKRLLYTPIKPIHILFGKMISANIISICQLLIMFLFAGLAFGLEIGSHFFGMLITIVATAFACSAFGVVLASFVKTRQQVQGLSTLLILVMSAIGGSMIPLLLLPQIMQKIAVISVNYWSIQAFYDIFWRNLSLTDPSFLSRIGVLLFMGGLLNGMAVYLFKRNILKLS